MQRERKNSTYAQAFALRSFQPSSIVPMSTVWNTPEIHTVPQQTQPWPLSKHTKEVCVQNRGRKPKAVSVGGTQCGWDSFRDYVQWAYTPVFGNKICRTSPTCSEAERDNGETPTRLPRFQVPPATRRSLLWPSPWREQRNNRSSEQRRPRKVYDIKIDIACLIRCDC